MREPMPKYYEFLNSYFYYYINTFCINVVFPNNWLPKIDRRGKNNIYCLLVFTNINVKRVTTFRPILEAESTLVMHRVVLTVLHNFCVLFVYSHYRDLISLVDKSWLRIISKAIQCNLKDKVLYVLYTFLCIASGRNYLKLVNLKKWLSRWTKLKKINHIDAAFLQIWMCIYNQNV